MDTSGSSSKDNKISLGRHVGILLFKDVLGDVGDNLGISDLGII